MTAPSGPRGGGGAATYPWWIKALFYGGLLGIAASLLSIFVAVFVPSMPGTDLLMLPCLAGLAALYVVAGYDVRKERRAHLSAGAARTGGRR